MLEKPKAIVAPTTTRTNMSSLTDKNFKRNLSDIASQYPHSGKPDKKYLIEKFQASQSQWVQRSHGDNKMDGYHRNKDSYNDHYSDSNRRPRRDSEGNRSHGGHVTPRKHNHGEL